MDKKLKKQISNFKKYIDDWSALNDRYHSVLKIPIYHFIKQWIILNKQIKLTNNYQKK